MLRTEIVIFDEKFKLVAVSVWLISRIKTIFDILKCALKVNKKYGKSSTAVVELDS